MSSESESGGERKKGKPQDQASLLQEIKVLIQGSESRTVGRIDEKIDVLSEALTRRLDSTERDVKRLGRNVKEMKGDILAMQGNIDRERADLHTTIGRVVEEKLAGLPASQSRQRPPAASQSGDKKMDSFFEARKSLRIWPLLDLSDDVVRDFFTSKLGITSARAEDLEFTAKRLASSRPTDPPNQALVTFGTSRQRDEVKAAARSLTDREVGVQMEPPDHLRSHFQTFQALAYQLKQKHPLLKRNVKFSDEDLALEMDFNVGDGRWRTIGILDARDALKKAKSKRSTATRRELAGLLGTPKHADISDSSSNEDDTMIVVSDSDDNQYKDAQSYPVSRLSVITANARSLVPKLESLFDCMSERNIDLACVTETWIKQGKQLNDLEQELRDAYSLGIISR